MRLRLFGLLALVAVCRMAYADGHWAGIYYKNKIAYGRVELRMKLVEGQGLVECFYLIGGKDDNTMPWREIDMEVAANHIDKIETCIHIDDNNTWRDAPWRYGHHVFSSGLDEEYHTYFLEWSPNHLSWGIDGEEYRRSETLEDGRMRDRQFDMGGSGCDVRDTIVDANVNYVEALKGYELRLDATFWRGPEVWCGTWTTAEDYKAYFASWFKFYEYTPGAGENGSDFTLADFDDFNGTLIDTTRWINLNPSDMIAKDGKAVFCQNPAGADGYSGTVPVDPEDGGTTVAARARNYHALPDGISLDENNLAFSVSEPGHYSAKLYNAHGKLVRSAGDKVLNAGAKLSVGKALLAPGTYVLQIRGSGLSMARQIVVQ